VCTCFSPTECGEKRARQGASLSHRAGRQVDQSPTVLMFPTDQRQPTVLKVLTGERPLVSLAQFAVRKRASECVCVRERERERERGERARERDIHALLMCC
jgi:hypothetical protein